MTLEQPSKATPLRRSTRHEPQVGSAKARHVIDWTHQWSGEPWHVRPTKEEDLHQAEKEQKEKANEFEHDQEDTPMETLFYEAFIRARPVRRKGKGKSVENERETFEVGDTVLIHSEKRSTPNVGVIVALWETRITHEELASREKFESMKVRVHWFVRPEQTARISARRQHLKNEVYFSLNGNATMAPADVIGHCTVISKNQTSAKGLTTSKRSPIKPDREKGSDSGDSPDDSLERPVSDVFICDLALDTCRGLYYEFNWGRRRAIAVEDGPRERETLWDVKVDGRKKKREEEPSGTQENSDEETDVYSQSSDDEDQNSEIHADTASEDEGLTDAEHSEDEVDDSIGPSKKRRRQQRRNVSSRKRQKRVQPTPHSKAALRARKKGAGFGRRHVATIVPPRATTDYAQLRDLPPDPWLRAMHVLHVGARPDTLPCRDNEYMEVMSAILNNPFKDISGVPGTGKTATVHAVVRDLKAMAQRNETNPFTYVEINGLKIPEPSAAYALLWEAVSGHDESAEGHLKISSKEALNRLNHHFGAGVCAGPEGHACVVLMDELDQLVTPKQDVIYNFFNWPSLASSRLIVIAVANTHDLPERVMSGKVRSRLGMMRINFHPYTRDQLLEIVHARLDNAKKGLESEAAVDVIKPDAVKFVAMKVSGISGDARRILDVCRRSVELIRSTGAKVVEIMHMNQVLDAMQKSPTAAYLQDCSLHERIMLASLLKCIKREGVEEIRWGDVQHQHRIYMDNLVGEDDPKRKPTDVELTLVLDSLVATRALLLEEGVVASRKHPRDRKLVLNIEPGEVERVLSDLGGKTWKNALGV